MNQIENIKRNHEDKVDLKGLFQLIGNYKWLIIFITLLSLLLSSIYIFFAPSVYSAYAIIEVKSHGKNNIKAENDLLQNAFSIYTEGIDKEIEILKTFNSNKKVIEKANYKIQIFEKNNYRKNELYGDLVPIFIKDINVTDKSILGKYIKLTPIDEGFKLEVESSIKDLILKKIYNNKNVIQFKEIKKNKFGKLLKNSYFTLSIIKKHNINRPIYFKINGDTHSIYKSIIENNLLVSQINKNAPLIKITYNDTIPERVAYYVNTLVDNFLKDSISEKNKYNNKILNFLKNQLNDIKIKLNSSENKLEKYKSTNQLIESSTQAKNIVNKLSNIEVKLSDFKLKEKLVNYILNLIIESNKFENISPLVAELGDTITVKELNSLEKLEEKKNLLSDKYTDEYPELRTINYQIGIVKNKILLKIKSLKLAIKYQIKNLNKNKEKFEKKLKTLPTKEKELANYMRKYKINSKLYAYLLEKKSENDIIKVATVSDYKIKERAYIPNIRIKPKHSYIILLALVLGFMVGISLAIILNKSAKKIRTLKDINTTIPLQGIIPYSNKFKNNVIEIFDNSQSFFADSYRKLRTDLQFLSKNNKSSIILITSSIKGEGKSHLTANLGAIFQLAGYRTIVIDLNLKNPSLHKYFDIIIDEGISSYLGNKNNISDIIFNTSNPNLDIIPVGSIPINPSELILSDRLSTLFSKLRERYDYILIDSAPLGNLTDTLSLMNYSDINLVVFRENYSKKIFISWLENIILKYNLKNIGIILHSKKGRDYEII